MKTEALERVLRFAAGFPEWDQAVVDAEDELAALKAGGGSLLENADVLDVLQKYAPGFAGKVALQTVTQITHSLNDRLAAPAPQVPVCTCVKENCPAFCEIHGEPLYRKTAPQAYALPSPFKYSPATEASHTIAELRTAVRILSGDKWGAAVGAVGRRTSV